MDFAAPRYRAPDGWPAMSTTGKLLRAVAVEVPGGSPGVLAMKFSAPAPVTPTHSAAPQMPSIAPTNRRLDMMVDLPVFGTFMELCLHIQREVGLPSTWTDPMLDDPNRPQPWWWEALELSQQPVATAAPPAVRAAKNVKVMSIL